MRRDMIIYIIAILSLAVIILFASNYFSNSSKVDDSLDAVVHHVSLKIIAPNWSIFYLDVTTSNNTVADLLFECADVYNFSVEKSFWTGYDSFFIEAINGTRNGEDGRYWQYYVNGEYADIGCSLYVLHDYDVVEWRFESSPWG